jgi:hypothetical protein
MPSPANGYTSNCEFPHKFSISNISTKGLVPPSGINAGEVSPFSTQAQTPKSSPLQALKVVLEEGPVMTTNCPAKTWHAKAAVSRIDNTEFDFIDT